MKIFRTLFLLVYLLLFQFLFAGTMEIDLEHALQRALENNLSLRTNLIDLRSAQRDKETSWNLFLPTVRASLSNVGSTELFHQTNAASPVYAQRHYISGLNAGLNVSLTLNPALQQQLRSYDLGYSLQEVTYEQARAEVKRNVTKLFYYLLAEGENLALQEKNIELAQRNLEKVRASYSYGFASELEVLSAELGVQRLLPALGQARNSYRTQMMAFKALLGLDLDTEVSLSGSLPISTFSSDVERLKQRIGSSLNLRILDMNVQNLENSKKLQRRYETGPSVSISGDYRINTEGRAGGAVTDWGDSLQYSVSVIIPLDGHIPNSRAQVSLAKIQDSIDKLRVNRQQSMLQMEQSFRTQIGNLTNLEEQMDLARANKSLAERVYGMTVAQFEGGYTDSLAVDDARNDLLSAEQSILYLQYQHASAMVDLAYDLNLEPDQL